jgi:long-chain fatty acid transport protein
MGRGNSVVASIDDATAMSFNPARLTALSNQEVSLGAAFTKVRTDYSGNGQTESADHPDGIMPSFHAASRVRESNWYVGIGATVPYGLASDWSDTGPLRYVTTESEIAVFDINPSVGFRINDSISVGAGISYLAIPEAKSRKQVNTAGLNTVLGFPDTAPDASNELKGDGDDWSYNVGLSYQLMDHHLFGLGYRNGAAIAVDGELTVEGLSGASAAVFGGTNYQTGARTKLYVPREVQFGYAYKTSNLVVEVDGQWNEWSAFRDQLVTFDETDPTRLSVLNNGNPAAKNWRNTWSGGIGMEYLTARKVALRAGYAFFDSPIPDETFDASVPDSDYHVVSFGAGVPVSKFVIDAAVQLYRLNDRKVDNDVGSLDGGSVDGTYKTRAEFYALTVKYGF